MSHASKKGAKGAGGDTLASTLAPPLAAAPRSPRTAAASSSPSGLADVSYPLPRRWLPLPDTTSAGSSALPPGLSFTVASYNLLAQTLVRRDMFPYSSKSSLKVNFRRDNLLAELMHLRADIFALQEVDRDLMEHYWKRKLEDMGYAAEWGARKESAKHGCAIFYRRDKFEKFSSSVIQFSELLSAPYASDPDAQHDDPATRKASVYEEMNRPNIAILLGLRVKPEAEDPAATKGAPMGLYVATTHLFWDPRYRFVRLKQCQTMLDHLAALQAANQTAYPTLIAGDFNVTPDNIIYHYLTARSQLEQNEEEWRKFLTPAEHGMMRGEDAPAASPDPAELSANSGISSSSLAAMMQAVRIGGASSEGASSAASPPPPSANVAPIFTLRTQLVTQADGSVKEQDVFGAVDHSTVASQARLAEVKRVLHHSKDLPLLRSVYADYDRVVPDDARESLRRSQAASYCRWTGEPPFTNYTLKFKGALDFIFLPVPNPASRPATSSLDECGHPSWSSLLSHATCQLHATHILEIPPEEAVSTAVALPNDTISSDHISIAARMHIARTVPHSRASSSPAAASTAASAPAPTAASSSSAASPSSASPSSLALAKSIAASLTPPVSGDVGSFSAAAFHSSLSRTPSPAMPLAPSPRAFSTSAPASFAPFNVSLFQSLLRTRSLGRSVHYSPSVTSTMDQCKEALFGDRAAAAPPPSGSIWLADEQTKGRGRVEGRVWSSPSNANIYLTLLLRLPSTQWEELRKVNQCVCLAVAQATEAAIASATRLDPSSLPDQLHARIKWPNDVWIGARKVSGMLIDAEHMGSEINLVIGVGVNVHEDMRSHPDPSLRESACSVQQAINMWSESARQPLTGSVALSRESILAHLLHSLESLLSRSMDEVLAEYRRYDMLLGERIVVMPRKKEDATSYYEATAIGYSLDGYLVVQTDSGEKQELVAEEVTIRPKSKAPQ